MPYKYHMNLAMVEYDLQPQIAETWKRLWPDARVIHYTLVKPFLPDDDGWWRDSYQSVFDLWQVHNQKAHEMLKQQ